MRRISNRVSVFDFLQLSTSTQRHTHKISVRLIVLIIKYLIDFMRILLDRFTSNNVDNSLTKKHIHIDEPNFHVSITNNVLFIFKCGRISLRTHILRQSRLQHGVRISPGLLQNLNILKFLNLELENMYTYKLKNYETRRKSKQKVLSVKPNLF